ncbi:MAG: hypothetical protein DRO73_08580 [Candidatus Thorarchaeota archaeon]|nr:MAG: hypothetical protein DRO73_08580 [Candidatus Thorarchaeota archaeon]
MYFELTLIPFFIVLVLFLIFFIVAEGSHWQKHRVLGPFARFIQASPFRSFVTFFILTIASIPVSLLVLTGFWIDAINIGKVPSNQTPIVNTLLVMMLLLAAMIPVMWSHFRAWRQAVRAMAEVRVRSV